MPPGNSAILTYHSLDCSRSVISTLPEVFKSHLEMLRVVGIPVCRLDQISFSPGAVAITFDDGFDNFREHALPLIADYQVPITVFVVSGYCGKQNSWPSQSPRVPRLPLMTWSSLREISAAGCELGSHTVTHPNLTELSSAETERELRQSKEEIEQRTGSSVRSFAYPYGAVNPRISALTSAQFDRACGTRLKLLTPSADHTCLPRIDAYYLRGTRHLKTLLQKEGQRRIAIRRLGREARQWLFQ